MHSNVSIVVMTHPSRIERAKRLSAQLDGSTIVVDPEPNARRGALRASTLAWAAADQHVDRAYHLVVQDDILLSASFPARLDEAVRFGPLNATAFYAHWHSSNGAAVRLAAVLGYGWVDGVPGDYVPAQALLMPRAAARGFARFASENASSGLYDDQLLERFLAKQRMFLTICVPCAVEHVGVHSLVTDPYVPQGVRRAACFAGRQSVRELPIGRMPRQPLIPMFRHGRAYALLESRFGQRPVPSVDSWQRIPWRSAITSLDLDEHDILGALSGSGATLGRSDMGIRRRYVESLWITAFMLGVLKVDHESERVRQRSTTSSAALVQVTRSALATIGPGGFGPDGCGERPLDQALTTYMSDVAIAGFTAGVGHRARSDSAPRP